MVLITEDLMRKSAEHNEGIISTLEEVALHQRDIEKIENLDKWCRDLKILDLTSNLISKIENLSRLKKLEYLKLGLNNIEKIENLEGCESLQKLDLTVNFIGFLSSVESLNNLEFFKEIFLTGNPCSKFKGYRSFVIGVLPQLERLDGVEITRTEKILALQDLDEIREEITEQEEKYFQKREEEKIKISKEEIEKEEIYKGMSEEEREKRFWKETTDYTPELRNSIYQHKVKSEQKSKPKLKERKVARLVTKEGKRLNVNEPKVKFIITEDQEGDNIVLDVALFKYLDSSLCEVDVQPSFVQVIIKKKVLQLVLPDEVNPDKSTALRSQATGRLIITMPRFNPEKKLTSMLPKFHEKLDKGHPLKADPPKSLKNKTRRFEKLEVDPSCRKTVLKNICNQGREGEGGVERKNEGSEKWKNKERENENNFIDDPSVPPLE